MELRTIQDWIVAPLLKPIPGVNEVNSFGGEVKQYQVLRRAPSKLRQVRPHRRARSSRRWSATTPTPAAACSCEGWEQIYLRGVGLLRGHPGHRARRAQGPRTARPVYLRDVADVVIGAEPRQGAVTRDGKGEVVAGMVIMLKGENSQDVVGRVKDAIGKVQTTLPPGARINVFYDRTSLIEACIKTVVDALLEGGLFVILVLFLFVAELRTALIVVVLAAAHLPRHLHRHGVGGPHRRT